MVRPRDLPKPVREHPAHENPADRHRWTPGPGAYHPVGFTSQSIQQEGRSFSKAARFRHQQASNFDILAAAHPGPCYNPASRDTRLSVSFKGGTIGQRTSSRGAAADAPGPGAYHPSDAPLSEVKCAPLIGFTKDTRDHRSSAGGTGSTPGPGTYGMPRKPSARQKPTAFFGSSKRSGMLGGGDAVDVAPPLTSLASMERGIEATRPPVAPHIRFPVSERRDPTSGRGPRNGGDVGPGQYTVADTYIRPNSRGTGFGTPGRSGRFVSDSQQRRGGVLGGNPTPFSSLSTASSAPAVSFSKSSRCSSADRERGEVGIGPAYNASYTQVDRHVKLCVPWKALSRPSSATSSASMPPGPSYIEPRSTLSGPAITFAKSKRQDGLADGAPGPGTYDARPLRRPDSASKSIGRAVRKTFDVDVDDGCAGSGGADVTLCVSHTKPSCPSFSFPRAARGGRPASAPASRDRDQGPSGLEYTPCYSQLDRNGHGAILYLTG